MSANWGSEMLEILRFFVVIGSAICVYLDNYLLAIYSILLAIYIHMLAERLGE